MECGKGLVLSLARLSRALSRGIPGAGADKPKGGLAIFSPKAPENREPAARRARARARARHAASNERIIESARRAVRVRLHAASADAEHVLAGSMRFHNFIDASSDTRACASEQVQPA